MGSLRYAIALFVMVAFPPSLAFWLVVHPFAPSWRRLGPRLSLAILYTVFVGAMVGLYLLRGRLLGGDLGANPIAICFGAVLFVASLAVFRGVRKELPVATQMGVPELTEDSADDRLLTSGI